MPTHAEYQGTTWRTDNCYGIWANMVQRCNNTNHHDYQYYGAKGIKICKSWHRYKNFIEDMGIRPSRRLTLDRINSSKGYYKENCRWATKTVQSINRAKQINNKSGIVGVSWDKSRHKWVAYIRANQKNKNLGRFDNLEDAISARETAFELCYKPLLS